jgi:hypothetical protein
VDFLSNRHPAKSVSKKPWSAKEEDVEYQGPRSGVVTPDFPKETKCITICMPGSSFMHIVTYKWIQKQYHVWKRKIIRDLHFILETKAPNITSSRLGVAYA